MQKGDELVDIAALLRNVSEDEQAIHHRVQFDSHAEAVLVEGDELQLNRLFQNLIDNAAEFWRHRADLAARCEAEAMQSSASPIAQAGHQP